MRSQRRLRHNFLGRAMRSQISICLTAAVLSGCGASPLPVGAPGTAPQSQKIEGSQHSSATYTLLHSFHQAPDGRHPKAGLIAVNGSLYGTTAHGGAYNEGTVFRISTDGTEKVLHSFGNGTDGQQPSAALAELNGTLYGTTVIGGAHGEGTVFSITVGGKESVLHSFSGTDGSAPSAGLVDVNGTLYGTTAGGGAHQDEGTVFSITRGGTEKVLHSFGNRLDGAQPMAELTLVNGMLYGTTYFGGADGSSGTVFSITTGGKESVLHSFGKDGIFPRAGLLNLNGTLYGTTTYGRYGNCCGTVFAITTAGKEKVLHKFSGADGAYPDAGLIDEKGTLYGTTGGGGSGSCPYGCGTLYSITTGGTETVLHSFGNGTDGIYPYAALIDVNGTLYGTTDRGGVHLQGTVFTLAP